jgi:hypothetical protein
VVLARAVAWRIFDVARCNFAKTGQPVAMCAR